MRRPGLATRACTPRSGVVADHRSPETEAHAFVEFRPGWPERRPAATAAASGVAGRPLELCAAAPAAEEPAPASAAAADASGGARAAHPERTGGRGPLTVRRAVACGTSTVFGTSSAAGRRVDRAECSEPVASSWSAAGATTGPDRPADAAARSSRAPAGNDDAVSEPVAGHAHVRGAASACASATWMTVDRIVGRAAGAAAVPAASSR